MTAAALWTLAASLAAADPAACSAGYKPEFAAEWGATKAAWDAHCAKGYDPLREVQRASVARCTAKFQPYEAKGKIPTGQAQAFCAQGASGRAALAAAAGLPAETAPAPRAPRIPPSKPGASGMGPLSRALDIAREAWSPQACFSGFHYTYWTKSYPDCAEIEAALSEGRGTRDTSIAGLDEYSYFFASTSVERDIYRVQFAQKLQDCPFSVYFKPPDHLNAPKAAGFSACLQGVKVDVGQAFDIAARNGWKADHPIAGYLAAFPAGFFSKACGAGTKNVGDEWKDTRVDCGPDWDMAKLRRATGGPVWVLTSKEQTAVVDAATGRFRFLGKGVFAMDLPL